MFFHFFKGVRLTVGILGGTFDPIHIGHLLLAQEVGKKLHFSKVLFVPSKIPPHKMALVPEEDRFRMVELAIYDNPFFEISRVELDHPQVSYTIETIRRLQAQMTEPLAFIIGSDNILDLPHWYQWKELLQLCRFAIGKRPGLGIETIDLLEPHLNKSACDALRQNFVEDAFTIPVSSSELRRRLAHEESVRYILPDPVIQYIQENRLYRAENGMK